MKLLVLDEVAEILRANPATIRRMIKQGKLRHIRVGTLIRFHPKQLEEDLGISIVDFLPTEEGNGQ